MENKNLQLIDFTMEEIIYLKSFVNTVNHFNVPKHTYHYGSYAEQCICINKNDENMWEVYIVERGKIHNKKTFGTFFDTCLESLKYGSRTKDEEKEMMTYFINQEIEMKKSLRQIEEKEIIPEVNNVLLQLKKSKN